MKPEPVNIVLMGLRGAGKSTIGALAAAQLGREFVDLDDRTAALLNARTVGEAFANHGESVFRIAEQRALVAALALPDHVVALGGGTPTAPGASQLLSEERDAGRLLIVYLRAEPRTLRSRLEATDVSKRPSLTGKGTLDEIEAVFRVRDPLYCGLASHIIEVQMDGPDELTRRIVELERGSQGER